MELVFCYSPDSDEIRTVKTENLSVSLNEWAAHWPHVIFFIATIQEV